MFAIRTRDVYMNSPHLLNSGFVFPLVNTSLFAISVNAFYVSSSLFDYDVSAMSVDYLKDRRNRRCLLH